MIHHHPSINNSRPEPRMVIYAASKNEAWLQKIEQAAKTENCMVRSAFSVTALVTQAPTGPRGVIQEDIDCLLIDYDPSTQQWSSIEQLLLNRGIKAPVILALDETTGLEAAETLTRIAHVVAMKSMEVHEIIETIHDARRLKELVAHQFDVLRCHQLYESLPERQRRIVDLVVDGAPNKQIATRLEVSVKTIERDRQRAYRQMNVSNTAEMTRVAILGSLHNVVFPETRARGSRPRALRTM